MRCGCWVLGGSGGVRWGTDNVVSLCFSVREKKKERRKGEGKKRRRRKKKQGKGKEKGRLMASTVNAYDTSEATTK